MEAEFNISTDFNQFIVFDSTVDFEDLYEKWTDETVESMFVQGDGYIAIGTMRNFYAPVLIRFESDRPVPAGSVDKTAHGVLDVPSGVVEVSGSTDNGLSGGTLNVPPGKYLVLVEYLNLGSIADDGIEGDDRYVITLTKSDA
ncbi:hypothetical protein ASG92_03955 [Arthrobacter sp. Soil736]|uniref:competence protein ComJ n=1 Tax=Arthrobacter sp. Soil736 TaxID=1736395 RepID=UPI0006F4DF6C|nr:competence protein ComJ [Arthrobacter sp. Soil736]KRE64061.1 hypothetical protein ASG92_03955 [Arthrobacter sp. Soil736]